MQQDVKDLIQAESYLAGLVASQATITERMQAAVEAGDFAAYAVIQAEQQALPALKARAEIQVLTLQKEANRQDLSEEQKRLAESVQAFKRAQDDMTAANKRATAAQVLVGRAQGRVSTLQDRQRSIDSRLTEVLRAASGQTEILPPVVRTLQFSPRG